MAQGMGRLKVRDKGKKIQPGWGTGRVLHVSMLLYVYVRVYVYICNNLPTYIKILKFMHSTTLPPSSPQTSTGCKAATPVLPKASLRSAQKWNGSKLPVIPMIWAIK